MAMFISFMFFSSALWHAYLNANSRGGGAFGVFEAIGSMPTLITKDLVSQLLLSVAGLN